MSHAGLTGVHHRAPHDVRDDKIEIGVVEHQRSRLASQFQHHALKRCSSTGQHAFADRSRTGETDQVDIAMRDQPLAHFRATPDQVDHATRQTGLDYRLHE